MFKELKITDIKLGDRHRKDMGDLSSLAGKPEEAVIACIHGDIGLEAGVVSGVEEAAADNAEDSEVTTHESPEEEIPME